ncbi:MAG TPA: hypothetical protein VN612_05040 [Acidobacteriaceae bacterium]|nr:hypothetical protein [Acidobacteriaceae bacterium]
MSHTAVIVLIIVIAVVLIAAAIIVSRRKRSEHLREKFGPEYDRTLREKGDARHAEAVLLDREKRVKKFPLRTLAAADRDRYADEWAAVQRRFVDDPAGAVVQADKLVTRVMEARGYPTGDFEQRAADLSVDYPVFVQNYRGAREITLRHAKGQSSTEDLRRAMVYFRSLFDELLGIRKPQPVEVTNERLAS